MWSASGLLGSRPASQVRRTWQSGQCSSPAARAERLAAAALWSQRVVPVREVVTSSSSHVCAGQRLTLLCVGAGLASPQFPSPQKGGNNGAQRPCGGWALTVCLCSYDACFSCGVQVVARLGVLRFGHRVGCVCCGVPLLIAPLPLSYYPLPCLLIPPPPRLIGVPPL